MNKLILGIAAFVIGTGLYFGAPNESSALSGTQKAAPEMEEHIQGEIERNSLNQYPAQHATEGNFDAKVNGWLRILSGQKDFETWKNAEWIRYPLGPGTHAWVVLVLKEGAEIGYMIIAATPEGDFQLAEYGLGERPLFSRKTLYRTLMQHGLITIDTDFIAFWQGLGARSDRLYINSLHAVWKMVIDNETYYFDAKTGEHLPLTEQTVSELSGAHFAAADQNLQEIKESLLVPEFDPFERVNWIKGRPLALKDVQDLGKMLHHEAQVTYSAQLFRHTVLAAFAVTGYQQWNDGTTYVKIEQDGPRYIPYAHLAGLGHFFQ